VEQSFGEALRLEGYDPGAAPARAGQTLAVDLYWQALAAPGRDYAVSLQLLDSSGRLVAQHDAPPVAGAYPTAHWQAGERVLDRHPLALPADLAGEYRLQVVVYEQATGRRLQVAGADAAALGQLQVGAQR
jgi:hypothetical protein